MKSINPPIDIIIPWVDGSDVEWIKQKELFQSENTTPRKEDSNIERYRDWDNLRYLFRGIEKHAPWVRKVHFVTCGHLPEWLDTSNPKLNIVNHSDYIPDEYLPTFSSRPIELNVHRIKELAEQFIYFNDDTFILKPLKKDYFFKNGMPRDQAGLQPILSSDNNDAFPHMLLNVAATINKNFSKTTAVLNHPLNWFSYKYSVMTIIRNILLMPYSYFPGFATYHLPSPLLKSVILEVWTKESELLESTSSNKFRTPTDVNQYLFKAWQLVSGNFYPSKIQKHKSIYFDLSINHKNAVVAIKKQKNPLICINDSGRVNDFDSVKREIIEAFDSILSEKSRFEL